jgi:hypothetical protein
MDVKWPASRPGEFIPGERATDIQWAGEWVGPRTGMDTTEKRKKFHSPPLLGIEPRSVVNILTELPRGSFL